MTESTTTASSPKKAKLTMTDSTTPSGACKDVASQEDGVTYSIQIHNPYFLADKQTRCNKLQRQLEKRTNQVKAFWAFTTNESCETNGDTVTLHARLNQASLTFVSLSHLPNKTYRNNIMAHFGKPLIYHLPS